MTLDASLRSARETVGTQGNGVLTSPFGLTSGLTGSIATGSGGGASVRVKRNRARRLARMICASITAKPMPNSRENKVQNLLCTKKYTRASAT